MKKQIVSFVGIAVFAVLAAKGIGIIEQSRHYISTNGLSDRIVNSDKAKLIISIITRASENTKELNEKSQEKSKKMIDWLLSNGIKQEEIKSTYSDLEYEKWLDRDTNKYTFKENIEIESSNVDLIASLKTKVRDYARDSNQELNSNVYYDYNNYDKLRTKMLTEAAQDARNRADRLANSIGKKVINTRSIDTGKFSITSPRDHYTSEYSYREEEQKEKRVRVVVKGVYDIGK